MKKNKLFFIVVVGFYLISFIVNFVVAIKYPDLKVNTINCLISFGLLFLLVTYAFFSGKKYRIAMLIGSISGLFIFLVQNYQSVIYDIWILDVLSALHYPFYALYVIPLFGINLLLEFSPAMYSLLIGAVFLVCFIISCVAKKNIYFTSFNSNEPSKY